MNGINPYVAGVAALPDASGTAKESATSTNQTSSSTEATQPTANVPSPQVGIATASNTDTVQLSQKAQIAQAMLNGASTQTTSPDPAITKIAQDIAAGIYRPPPKAIADALVRYETMFIRGKA